MGKKIIGIFKLRNGELVATCIDEVVVRNSDIKLIIETGNLKQAMKILKFYKEKKKR